MASNMSKMSEFCRTFFELGVRCPLQQFRCDNPLFRPLKIRKVVVRRQFIAKRNAISDFEAEDDVIIDTDVDQSNDGWLSSMNEGADKKRKLSPGLTILQSSSPGASQLVGKRASSLTKPDPTSPAVRQKRKYDEASEVKSPTENTSWSCPTCTFMNEINLSNCECCDQARAIQPDSDEWACATCTYVNKKSVISCGICSTNRTNVTPTRQDQKKSIDTARDIKKNTSYTFRAQNKGSRSLVDSDNEEWEDSSRKMINKTSTPNTSSASRAGIKDARSEPEPAPDDSDAEDWAESWKKAEKKYGAGKTYSSTSEKPVSSKASGKNDKKSDKENAARAATAKPPRKKKHSEDDIDDFIVDDDEVEYYSDEASTGNGQTSRRAVKKASVPRSSGDSDSEYEEEWRDEYASNNDDDMPAHISKQANMKKSANNVASSRAVDLTLSDDEDEDSQSETDWGPPSQKKTASHRFSPPTHGARHHEEIEEIDDEDSNADFEMFHHKATPRKLDIPPTLPEVSQHFWLEF
jgi:hypothetical protein